MSGDRTELNHENISTGNIAPGCKAIDRGALEREKLIKKDIGGILKRVRVGRCIKQIEVARILGMSQANLCRIETGRQSITVEQLVAFADLYYLPNEYLLKMLGRGE